MAATALTLAVAIPLEAAILIRLMKRLGCWHHSVDRDPL